MFWDLVSDHFAAKLAAKQRLRTSNVPMSSENLVKASAAPKPDGVTRRLPTVSAGSVARREREAAENRRNIVTWAAYVLCRPPATSERAGPQESVASQEAGGGKPPEIQPSGTRDATSPADKTASRSELAEQQRPRTEAEHVAAEIVNAGRVRRGEIAEQQKPAPADKTASMILNAGRQRRGEIAEQQNG